MDDGPAGHAMTEIALALAMSFFCLLVVALVSLGTPAAEPGVDALTAASGDRAEAMAPTDRLAVLHGGRLLDAHLRPLDPVSLAGAGRVVLAVDPAAPMADVLAARGRLAAVDLLITALDPAWLAALGREGGR